ncbi:right-handed parallel beta-helix repeat-containing protein [Pararhizobium antarcticum]|uniref:Periplasmic copper-binding protein NosD beta helix domain-containing protein n=1 Tax=Pararhizobium antarcticum TaxID=1798805 RepID=A0A657LNC8_9HYPH|nr:right-handed parallel beta-helix repeat-containing protein [Pararhizobium antarcticum]OJF91671.1 hypothetical protein AX760_23180 [Pararhizobium antarcticum]OJF96121.1 hypothetical protein AX761_16295 [Rhizobium sp. 58]
MFLRHPVSFRPVERLSSAPLRLSSVALLACALCLLAGGLAQGQTAEIDTIAKDVRQGVLDADAAKDIDARIAAISRSREQFGQLLLRLQNGIPEVENVVEALSSEGVTADILTSSHVSALAEKLKSSRLDAEARTGLRSQLLELIDSVGRPELRIAAIGNYALSLVNTDRFAASAALDKAVVSVEQITEPHAKNAVLNSIAQIGTIIDPQITSLNANRAISRMWPARMRAYARYDIALRILNDKKIAGKPIKEAKKAEILKQSATALQRGDLENALVWALAVPPEDSESRKAGIDAVTDTILKNNELSYLPIVASSLSDASDQEDLIVRIIRNRLELNRALDAVAFAEFLAPGPLRAQIDFAIAAELQDRGLTKMATELYEGGVAIARRLGGAERDVALVAAINGAISLDRTTDALAFLPDLTKTQATSDAVANVAKSLADQDRIPEAEALLPSVTRDKDRDEALSGIGRAKVKAGDLAGGELAIKAIGNLRDKGRVQSEMARAYAKQGDFGEAQSMIAAIKDENYQIEALLRVAKEMRVGTEKDAFHALVDRALQATDAQADAKDRDNNYLDIVELLSSSKDTDMAKRIVQKIADDKIKAKAVGLISKSSASLGQFNQAFDYLAGNTFANSDEALRGDVLVELSRFPELLKMASLGATKLRDDRIRVRVSRSIAEIQLAGLDSFGLGHGKNKPEDYRKRTVKVAATSVETNAGSSVFGNNALKLSRVAGLDPEAGAYSYPDVSLGVASVRALIPLPRAGRVSTTLANLSPFNDKFLEDLAAGNTGLTFAATAQATPYPRIIVVERGVYTLGSLATELAGNGTYPLVTRKGDIVTLRAPLLVAKGASLILSGQEASAYRMSVEAGSFIAVAGTLYVNDTTVTSWEEEHARPRYSDKSKRQNFRPYIIGWSNSKMMIGGSTLDSLGYAAPKSFGLSFSAGPKTVVQNKADNTAPTGIVADNYFHNFEYGFYSYEAEEVSLVGNEYRDNVLYAVDPHDRSHRLLIALNTAYDTKAKHGIIVSREVNESWIVGNVSHGNTGSGFMIDRNSVDNYVYGNVAFNNEQDGLTFFESSCNLAVSNRFFDNKRAGIKIRNSWDIGVHGNILEKNKESAIHGYISNLKVSAANALRDFELDPYLPITTFSASRNRLAGNGDGIKVNGASAFSLSNNDYLGQMGRLVDGDARAFEGHILRFNQHNRVVITATACVPKRPVDHECKFLDNGYLGATQQSLMLSTQSAPAACTDVPGSVQGKTFNAKGDNS